MVDRKSVIFRHTYGINRMLSELPNNRLDTKFYEISAYGIAKSTMYWNPYTYELLLYKNTLKSKPTVVELGNYVAYYHGTKVVVNDSDFRKSKLRVADLLYSLFVDTRIKCFICGDKHKIAINIKSVNCCVKCINSMYSF